MLRLVVLRGAPQYTNVLCDVLLTDKIAHVVLVSHVVLLIVLLLLLLDLRQLAPSQLRDLTEHLRNALALSLNRHAAQLILHLRNDPLRPPADLVIDQLHVLFALLQTLELSLQLLGLGLQFGILGLTCLGRIV